MAPIPAPKIVAMITRKPAEIELKTGRYLRKQVIRTATITTISTDLVFLQAGIIMAMNIANNAIPIAFLMESVSAEQTIAPSAVPKVQPRIGPVTNPSIYGFDNFPFSLEATTKVSSVIANPKINLCFNVISLFSFCVMDNDINIYRILMTKVVSIISRYPEPAIIKLVPANCPALVRFEKDIKMASQIGRPPSTAMDPKVKETGM